MTTKRDCDAKPAPIDYICHGFILLLYIPLALILLPTLPFLVVGWGVGWIAHKIGWKACGQSESDPVNLMWRYPPRGKKNVDGF